MHDFIFTPFEVIHEQKGAGTALGYRADKDQDVFIKIQFLNGALQEFLFPDCFRFHMVAANPDLHAEILKILNKKLTAIVKGVCLKAPVRVADSAKETYHFCCYKLNCKPQKAHFFGPLKICFADDATPDGLAVWCLPNNDIIKSPFGKRAWYNFVSEDTIEEIWITKNFNTFFQNKSARLTFVKTQDGYKFWGIFKPIGNGTKVIDGTSYRYRKYGRISGEYSL